MRWIMILVGLLIPTFILAATNPAYLKLTVYKFAVSESVLCTDPVTVFESDTPTEVDFLETPTLGSGELADGTYNCVIIEFDDTIVYAPEADDGTNCVANTEYDLDVCNDNGDSTPFQLIDGTSGTCDATEQRVAMYLSTASTSTGGNDGANAFSPPTSSSDASFGFNLASALVVSGDSVGSFVVNATGKIEDNQNDSICEMQPPLFSFE